MDTPTFIEVLDSISYLSDLDRTKPFEVTLRPNNGVHVKYIGVVDGREWHYLDNGIVSNLGTIPRSEADVLDGQL